jgi:hypothetical protein
MTADADPPTGMSVTLLGSPPYGNVVPFRIDV